LDQTRRETIIQEYRSHEKDTGSEDLQVALLTQRISDLTQHLRVHPKDNHSRRGLLQMVGQRRRLLRYINREEVGRYRQLISRLGLRR